MMAKERVELLFVLLFAYLRTVKQQQLIKTAEAVKNKAKSMAENTVEDAKHALPLQTK